MRRRGGGDDPRRRGCGERFAQRRRQQEIGHVIEREGQLQTFGRRAPVGKHRAGVVDQHVDARSRRAAIAAPTRRVSAMLERSARCTRWPSLGAIASSLRSVASARPSSRATKTMRAPARASSRTAASPIPDVAPVATTVLPCMVHAFFRRCGRLAGLCGNSAVFANDRSALSSGRRKLARSRRAAGREDIRRWPRTNRA